MRALAALMVLALSALVGLGAATPYATIADVNAKQDASTNLTAVAAGGGIAANWQASGTNSVSIGNTTVVSQHGYSGYAVADLPTGVAAGYQTYCTDCLTPWGTGDRVEWDGSAWRTLRVKVKATASADTYILDCLTQGLNYYTGLSDIGVNVTSAGTGPTWSIPRVATGSYSGTTTNGPTYGYTTTTSFSRAQGVTVPGMISGCYYACGGRYYASAAPDGTDNYAAWIGMESGASTNYPTSGVFFLYDRYNEVGVVSNATFSATWTNNWICVAAKPSTYSYVDSGLQVAIGGSTFDNLQIVYSATAANFYTNGVQCASITNSSALPTVAMYLDKVVVVKSLGSGSRGLGEVSPWFHVRRNVNRFYGPP